MKHLIIVNGYPRVGKDTLISEMLSLLAAKGVAAMSYSMIDPTIEMLEAHPAIPRDTFIDKNPHNRQLLAAVHRALLDCSSYPILAVFNAATDEDVDVLFTCCREPDTILRLVNRCRGTEWVATTILVERNEHAELTNAADTNVKNYPYDIVVDNNQPLAFMPDIARDTLRKISVATNCAVPSV